MADWMGVVIDTRGFCFSNIMHYLDGGLRFFESETTSSNRFLIDQRVKIDKASTELDLFTIKRDAAVRALSLGLDLGRDVVDVNREEPRHPCLL